MELLIVISIAALCVVVAFLGGILVGSNEMRKAVEKGSVGHLRIDRSEPEEPPRPFLEIAKGSSIESISQMKFVILKVVNENYISCE